MTDIDQVRLLIGDTGSVQFTDAQIQAFLTMASGSVLFAASLALESWAASISGNLKSEKIGDYSYSTDAVNNKIALAKKYREEDATIPAFEWSELNLSGIDDTYISEDIE